MASKTLYAPQVKPIQPAFTTEDDNITIKYSLSKYNTDTEYQKVVVTIIDPNLASGWGANTMINNADFLVCTPNGNAISIPISDLKELTVNQFYQVQLFLLNEEEFNGDFNSDKISLGSQVTLIKQINAPVLSVLLSNKIPFIDEIQGELTYESKSDLNDYISSYEVIIDNQSVGIVEDVFSYSFSYQLPFVIDTEGDHDITVRCVTSAGYVCEKTTTVSIIAATADSTLTATPALYSIQIEIDKTADEYCIQRSLQGTNLWQTIGRDSRINDITFESGLTYSYRGFTKVESNWYVSNIETVSLSIDNIYLIGKNNTYFTVAYNPQISNMKYITQESMTNTLGGKYPIVRKNAKTGYFQFTLSGLISGEETINSLILPDGVDSLNNRVNPNEVKTKHTNLLDSKQNLLSSLDKTYETNLLRKREVFEKIFRDEIVKFLTNVEIKYFKSASEGNKIVSLSNINFSPEIRLGRDIYSFSATVTEIADATDENLKRYGLGGN